MSENLKKTIEDKARAACDPLVVGEGMELVDLEFVREREGWILRLFIDGSRVAKRALYRQRKSSA